MQISTLISKHTPISISSYLQVSWEIFFFLLFENVFLGTYSINSITRWICKFIVHFRSFSCLMHNNNIFQRLNLAGLLISPSLSVFTMCNAFIREWNHPLHVGIWNIQEYLKFKHFVCNLVNSSSVILPRGHWKKRATLFCD